MLRALAGTVALLPALEAWSLGYGNDWTAAISHRMSCAAAIDASHLSLRRPRLSWAGRASSWWKSWPLCSGAFAETFAASFVSLLLREDE